jgi:putative sigma-54 modulation protein
MAEDLFSAVDRVAQKIDKQLRRYKDRRASARKNAGRSNGHTHEGTLRVLRAGSIGRGADLHESTLAADYEIATMTIDEAIAALDAAGREFLVFAHRGTDSLHVVYKVPDGDFGVLDLHASA